MDWKVRKAISLDPTLNPKLVESVRMKEGLLFFRSHPLLLCKRAQLKADVISAQDEQVVGFFQFHILCMPINDWRDFWLL